jgi:uncharacterized repeat protein (TIGR01451 family)
VKQYIFKQIFVFTALGVIFASKVVASAAMAQYYSQGGDKPGIVIDKKIRPIEDKIFVDNISADQKSFVEGDQLEFKIVVNNPGNVTLTNIKVTDLLPKYLDLLFFPGVYNKSNNSIETSLEKLDPGQSKEYFIRVIVDDLPTSIVANKKLLMINKATAVSDQASDSDQARYYVTANTVPSTGSNDIVFKTIVAVMVTVAGVGLRKAARGY